jgi:hypothetical protein
MGDRKNQVSLLMTDDENAQLEALAAGESTSPASWLRLTIALHYAEKFGTRPPRKPKREKKLLRSG